MHGAAAPLADHLLGRVTAGDRVAAHCRRLAPAIAGAIELHVRRGDDVILVGIEGSPSMGVHVTSSDPDRCGRPEWPEGSPELSPGTGIFMEELEAELCDRGIESP